MSGPIGLVGSGEYLPVMLEVERSLLDGRPGRYVQLPTAASLEGEATLNRWIELGRIQAQRLGVEAVALRVVDRASADDPEIVAQVAGAGLIYLSGGNPAHLVSTLRDSGVWAAIAGEWRRGAAIAGCSAGAMALAEWLINIRAPGAEPVRGLGIVPSVRVIPHFDRFERVMPAIAADTAATPAGQVILGIDEETALVSLDDALTRWRVLGRRRVCVIRRDAREEYGNGEVVDLDGEG